MAKLYLVRHGQTKWNAEKRFQGSMDIPLNETGREQAQEASKKLSEIPFVAVYSSHLQRARETAEILKGDRSHPIQIEEDLREGSFGSLEGQSYAEHSPWDDLHHLSHEERLHHKWVEDQESAHEVMERVIPCLKKIAIAHENREVLIVTHGGVMRTLLTVLEGRDWTGLKILNTEVLIFEWTAEKTLRLHPLDPLTAT